MPPDERASDDSAEPTPAEPLEGPSPEAAPADDAPLDGALRFEVRLGVFDGPLDLLLHLIERRELDITTVSLLEVTEQYMEHVRSGDGIDIDALADFIGVGARLLLLKSRALLPIPPAPDGEDDDGDPEALVEALREYRRFKLAADRLDALQQESRRAYRREAAPPAVPMPTGLRGVDMEGLFAVLREILAQAPKEEAPAKRATLPRPTVRLRDRLRVVVDRLEREPVLSFRALVSGAPSRLAIIIDFLAVLELIKAGYLEARQGEAFGDIELARRPNVEPPPLARIAEEYAGV